MAEYISKQRAKDLMGCCLASAKAEYKVAKDEFTKARFGDYISTIQAMIDVVGAVEVADVQLVNYTENLSPFHSCDEFVCKNCGLHLAEWVKLDVEDYEEYEFKFCPECGSRIGGDSNG